MIKVCDIVRLPCRRPLLRDGIVAYRWKGASSDVFVLEAVRLMESKGYRLGNIDITVIAERPKLSPHKQKILDSLYGLLKSPPDTINLKASIDLLWGFLYLGIHSHQYLKCRRRHLREWMPLVRIGQSRVRQLSC